jgi:hypothetical protein
MRLKFKAEPESTAEQTAEPTAPPIDAVEISGDTSHHLDKAKVTSER